MAGLKILVVEDERIVARDLQTILTRLGYAVPVVVASGEEALRAVADHSPDLVLMDIRLSGGMDGIRAAQAIRDSARIPVVYLTAFSDVETLKRARVTEAYGYILKPVDEKDLQGAIEIARYRHLMDGKLRQSEERLVATLRSIADGVVATDGTGSIIFLNPAAEQLTGWRSEEAAWKAVSAVVDVIDEQTRQPAPGLLASIRDGTGGVVRGLVLVDRQGNETAIEIDAAPMKDDRGEIAGGVLVLRDVSDRKRAEAAKRQAEALSAVTQLARAAAHEINNPLTVVKGRLELIAAKSGDDAALRKDIDDVIRAVEQISDIVSRMRRITRLELDEQSPGLPPMLDLRRSGADPAGGGPPER